MLKRRLQGKKMLHLFQFFLLTNNLFHKHTVEELSVDLNNQQYLFINKKNEV
jgi:hypothetical protein